MGLDLVANFYYILLVAMGLLYMFYSFQSKLPWASCGNEWNTEGMLAFFLPLNNDLSIEVIRAIGYAFIYSHTETLP